MCYFTKVQLTFISLYSLAQLIFNHQKALLWYLTYCRYIPIFSLFLEAVYSVGKTEVWLSFMCKITYNSLNVDQINSKFSLGICL